MTFSIDRVELTNFRSFIGTHTFDLPTEPGLFFLTGRNLAHPELGSNGSGKSTLLDSIYWTLFGRTTRGLKASDVVSWDQKGCSVAVTLTVGDKWLRVSRSQSPNTLTLTEDERISGHPIDQGTLEKYLRLTAEAFLYSVMLPQFGLSFFDLSPAAKLTLFSDIMGLEYWLERSQAADAAAKALDTQRVKVEASIAKIRGQLETTEGDIALLMDREATYASTQANLIQKMKADLAELVKDTFVDEELKAVEGALAGLQGKLAKAVTQECPTCKQKRPHPDARAIRQNIEDFERKLVRVQREQDMAKQKQASLKASIATEAKRENPYSSMIEEKVKSLDNLVQLEKATKLTLGNVNEEHAAVSFWVGGFKRVRLFIVEEALQQLELEVNNNLTSLGLMEWRIAFDVERENKSGGVTKGFIVLIYPPEATEPVRYEGFSGGETQRLRMAGDLGLANLIMERAGLSNTVEFYDEPSRHLSQEGLLDLAELLAQRAEAHGKRIFLVDHHVVDYSGFAGTILVVKDADGSRLTQQG